MPGYLVDGFVGPAGTHGASTVRATLRRRDRARPELRLLVRLARATSRAGPSGDMVVGRSPSRSCPCSSRVDSCSAYCICRCASGSGGTCTRARSRRLSTSCSPWCPTCPRSWWYRLPFVAALAFATGAHRLPRRGSVSRLSKRLRRTSSASTRKLPRAPKLLYLVFNHDGSTRSITPFIHLPAWVQAEKGGALSASISSAGTTARLGIAKTARTRRPPCRSTGSGTRAGSASRRTARSSTGSWCDATATPATCFAADRSIHLVDHDGSWWLFKRDRPAPGP